MSATVSRTIRHSMRAGLFAAGAFIVAQSFATPASAGLLDFLFGRPQPQYYVVATPPPSAPLAAKPVKRVVREVPRGPRPYVAPEVVEGPLGRFLRDPSLRRGDVVATPNGLMVFQGRAGSTSHRPSDFAPVASAGVGGARRADLLTLDRTVRSSPANVEFVAEKAEPKTLVIAKRAENDTRAAVAGAD
jgi:hypothetical protein